MTTLLALLILGANASAQRSMTVEDQTIAGIVLQVVAGGINDALPKLRRVAGGSAGNVDWPVLDVPALRIDGEPRAGWRAWGEAVCRIAGYATDLRDDGSIGYAYLVQLRGMDVTTSTTVLDGYVWKTISTGWIERVEITRRITREIPIHVVIVITATERGTETYLVGTATGYADTRDFRCRLVRRIAEQRAATELRIGLADALRRIQDGGTRLYLAGDTREVIAILRSAVKIGRAVR